MAEHYVNEKREDLFFELTNEPNLSLPDGEKIDQVDWRALAQQMIDSIRTVDKTRPIIFGDVEWYSLDMLIKSVPFKDQFIIYCFHMYDPFIFTHQGASWTSMATTKNVPFPYNEKTWSTDFRTYGIQDGTPEWTKNQFKEYYKIGNKNHIKNRLILVKNWAYKYNVPLICNEWGAYSKSAKIEDLNSYFKTMGEIFQELDISWQVWFGIMDNNYNLLSGMPEALDLKKK
jgi:licheninase